MVQFSHPYMTTGKTIVLTRWNFVSKIMPLLFNMLSWFVIASVTLPAKVHIVKAMVFPVVMYGCENWTIKKGECQRIDAFELWYWRRFLRVPWTARRSNQSILKEINPNIHWKD